MEEYLSGVLAFLKRFFGAAPAPTLEMSKAEPIQPPLKKPADMSWFFPPRTIADVPAWDKYWTDQITHGLTPGLFDMMNFGGPLAAVMTQLGMQTVLCAGNGISQEPRALAEAGFTVTALDPSSVAVNHAKSWNFGPRDYEMNVGSHPRREGGRVEFVLGDILNPETCPGPFDVVIERRMLQLFEPERRPVALAALASRVAENGILFSHMHSANWRPGDSHRHPLEELFLQTGWQLWNPNVAPRPPGRVAWLCFSTG